jgi:hypothetical protein
LTKSRHGELSFESEDLLFREEVRAKESRRSRANRTAVFIASNAKEPSNATELRLLRQVFRCRMRSKNELNVEGQKSGWVRDIGREVGQGDKGQWRAAWDEDARTGVTEMAKEAKSFEGELRERSEVTRMTDQSLGAKRRRPGMMTIDMVVEVLKGQTRPGS